MPFQVYLSPTTASPPDAQIQADVRAAIVADGGRFARDGVTVVTSDGLRITLAGDDKHLLADQLSPSLCRIVFNAARQSISTVDRGGSDVASLQMKGSAGATLYIRVRTDPIADPVALCAPPGRAPQDWKRFMSDAQSSGAPGLDEQSLGPPPTPGTEPRVDADSTGVTAHCDAVAKFGFKIVRKVVSRNAQYGVVWRADVTMPGASSEPSRMICWRVPGRAGYSVVDRPLEMLDPSASIPPLAP